jgi:hypothetical protein
VWEETATSPVAHDFGKRDGAEDVEEEPAAEVTLGQHARANLELVVELIVKSAA